MLPVLPVRQVPRVPSDEAPSLPRLAESGAASTLKSRSMLPLVVRTTMRLPTPIMPLGASTRPLVEETAMS